MPGILLEVDDPFAGVRRRPERRRRMHILCFLDDPAARADISSRLHWEDLGAGTRLLIHIYESLTRIMESIKGIPTISLLNRCDGL